MLFIHEECVDDWRVAGSTPAFGGGLGTSQMLFFFVFVSFFSWEGWGGVGEAGGGAEVAHNYHRKKNRAYVLVSST